MSVPLRVIGVSAAPAAPPKHFLPNEASYIPRLQTLQPLESILDEGAGQCACRAIGQEAFDFFKTHCGASSRQAGEALVRICDALWDHEPDGRLRKQYVERAWDGIGDSVWQWQA